MTEFSPDDVSGMLAGVARIQRDLEAAQSDVASTRVVGSAGGGAVTIVVSGDFSFDQVTIDPSIIETGDASIIEDLVLAALKSAVEELTARRRSAIGNLMSGALGSLLSPEDPKTE